MRALVVYESMFGNTERIARAVAAGLAASMPVQVDEVGAAPCDVPPDVDLVVAGGPTHAFGLTRASTRADAQRQASTAVISRGIGLREWLVGLTEPTAAVVATFDTRIRKPHLPGSAARAAEKQLRRLGFRIIAPAESFYVEDVAGPLSDDEESRARAWGAQLARTMQHSRQPELS